MVAQVGLDRSDTAKLPPFVGRFKNQSCPTLHVASIFCGNPHDPVKNEAHASDIAVASLQLSVDVLDVARCFVPGIPADMRMLANGTVAHSSNFVFPLAGYAVFFKK